MKVESMEAFGKAIDDGYEVEVLRGDTWHACGFENFGLCWLKENCANGKIRTKPKTINIHQYMYRGFLFWVDDRVEPFGHLFECPTPTQTRVIATATIEDKQDE